MKRGSRNECSFGGYECLDRSSSEQIATTYDITSSHDHRLFFLLIGDIILPIRRSNILLYPIRCATSIAVSGREALSGRFPACIVAKCQRFVRCRHCLLSLDEDNTLYHRHFPFTYVPEQTRTSAQIFHLRLCTAILFRGFVVSSV